MLISDKPQRFESIFKPCKVDLTTRHMSTPRVSYGNLSQAHLRDLPRHTPTQGFCAYLLTPGVEPAAFRLDHQFLALPEGVRPVGRTALSIRKILQVTSVYRAP